MPLFKNSTLSKFIDSRHKIRVLEDLPTDVFKPISVTRDVRKRTFGHVRPAKIQFSLRIRTVSSEYLLSAFWISKDTFLHTFSCWQQRLLLDCADVQADFSLRWTHALDGTFTQVAAHIRTIQYSLPTPYLPSFSEDNGDEIAEYFSLISNIFHDILGPFHKISYFITRRRSVDVPFKHFFNFLP